MEFVLVMNVLAVPITACSRWVIPRFMQSLASPRDRKPIPIIVKLSESQINKPEWQRIRDIHHSGAGRAGEGTYKTLRTCQANFYKK
jgi:hypothetical protein